MEFISEFEDDNDPSPSSEETLSKGTSNGLKNTTDKTNKECVTEATAQSSLPVGEETMSKTKTSVTSDSLSSSLDDEEVKAQGTKSFVTEKPKSECKEDEEGKGLNESSANKYASIPCVLCQNSLEIDGPRTPYLLECGHILCADCLSNVSTINDASSAHQLIPPATLRCAHCFNVSSLPLTKHYALIRTFLKIQCGDFAEIVCQECLRIEAVVDCSDCQLALCEECDDKRHADPTGEHVRELIDLNTLCLEHCKGKMYYCLVCAESVCSDCTTIGMHRHHNHEIREDLSEEQRLSLSTLVSTAESKLQAVNTFTQKVQETAADKISSKIAINKAFEELHTSLQNRRKALLQQLDESAQHHADMTETLTKDVDSIKKDCEESLNLLHERISRCFNFDSTSQLNAEDSVAVWNNFISRKNIILPPDEYKAVVGRLENASGVDVSRFESMDFSPCLPTSLATDVSSLERMIDRLGEAAVCDDTNTDNSTSSSSPRRSKRKIKDDVAPKKTKAAKIQVKEEEDDSYEIPKKETPARDKKKKSVIHLGRQESGVEFSKLKVGDKVDCLDSSNRWAEAEIIKISKSTKQVLVSYLYWGNEWDEWVSDVSYNLAPLKTHTYYAGGPLEIGFRVEVLHDNVWREGFIMNKKGDKIKVYYEDFSNTTQTKWVDYRDDCIRQFGLYNKGANADDLESESEVDNHHEMENIAVRSRKSEKKNGKRKRK